MVKDKIILRNIQPPALSSTSIIDLPIGYRYHTLIVELGYTSGTNTVVGAAAQIAEVRLVANGGQLLRKVTGTELHDMSLLNGTTYAGQGLPNTSPGVALAMHFAEPWRTSAADRDALALATVWRGGGLTGLQLQVDVGAAIASASAPTLAASAIVDKFVPEQQPGMVKWVRQDITSSGTSFDVKIDALGLLQAIHLYADTGSTLQTSKVTVRQGDHILHELTKTANFAFLTNMGMAPTQASRTAKITDIMFDHDDLLLSSVPLAGGPDPVLTIETATSMAAGYIRAIIERLDRI